MSNFTGVYKGDIVIESNATITGIVTGAVVVQAGGKLELIGIVCQDLIIQEGGLSNIFGIVTGNVTNYGRCNIYGTVNGKILDHSNNVVIDPKAKIGNL